jgi:hypothetical protein
MRRQICRSSKAISTIDLIWADCLHEEVYILVFDQFFTPVIRTIVDNNVFEGWNVYLHTKRILQSFVSYHPSASKTFSVPPWDANYTANGPSPNCQARQVGRS